MKTHKLLQDKRTQLPSYQHLGSQVIQLYQMLDSEVILRETVPDSQLSTMMSSIGTFYCLGSRGQNSVSLRMHHMIHQYPGSVVI